MPTEPAGVRLSTLDLKRFGVLTARADGVTSGALADVLDFCDANNVELAIVRCGVEDIAATHALMTASFLLMDTLVYYERDLAAAPVEMRAADGIEELQIGDPEQVEAIARESFRDYLGHYHADLRLDRNACVEVYASWARASCDRIGPDEFVLVVGNRENRIGFSTFRRNKDSAGELVLGAVAQAARGRGLYRDLTIAGMMRFQASGAKRFVTSTHLGNWGAQAAWTSAGLRPVRAFHTFHRWFERT